jgi:hypothetical protein
LKSPRRRHRQQLWCRFPLPAAPRHSRQWNSQRAGWSAGTCRALFGSGEAIVREGCVGPNEYVVGYSQPIPQLHATLDGDSVADDDVVFDEDVIADVAVPTYDGTGKQVAEGPDTRAAADRCGFADGSWMAEVGHGGGC